MSNNEKSTAIVPQEIIESKILIIRNRKVLIDRDLAELYGVTTGNLNKAVKRNIERFPEDFMFQLTKEEFENLKFQFGISRWGGTRKLPFPKLSEKKLKKCILFACKGWYFRV